MHPVIPLRLITIDYGLVASAVAGIDDTLFPLSLPRGDGDGDGDGAHCARPVYQIRARVFPACPLPRQVACGSYVMILIGTRARHSCKARCSPREVLDELITSGARSLEVPFTRYSRDRPHRRIVELSSS
jgi:hypothetical protein